MADSKKYNGSTWEHSLRKLTTATEAVENPLYSDGTAITSYTIKGNTVQNGTPTPDNPVDVNGVGERTENLFDVKNATETDKFIKDDGTIVIGVNGDKFLLQTIQCQPDTQYTFSWKSIVLGSDHNTPYIRVAEYDGNNNFILRKLINCLDVGQYKRRTITTSSQTVKLDIRYDYNCSRGQTVNDVMLNTGSTAKPYEPYGYKIPISSEGQTIDIYIGNLPLLKSLDNTAVDEISNGTLTRRVDSDGSVLPAPITTQITMPSIPTTEGANSITVDTTVQPSEFTATWTGWHNASVKEWDETEWS